MSVEGVAVAACRAATTYRTMKWSSTLAWSKESTEHYHVALVPNAAARTTPTCLIISTDIPIDRVPKSTLLAMPHASNRTLHNCMKHRSAEELPADMNERDLLGFSGVQAEHLKVYL